MLTLAFHHKPDAPLSVLCLGAHADDIEIGCGGTLLKLAEQNRNLSVHWVVLSATPSRSREARQSAKLFLRNAGRQQLVLKRFRDSYFPFVGTQIKNFMHQLSRQVSPDVIFTHQRGDLHQDHRLVAELTRNAFRNHLVLEYEIPKYDGDLGTPNVYVHIDQAVAEQKVKHICQTFKTQRKKQWFDADTFLALLRLRGVESNSPTKYAEAFYCPKMLLG